MTTPDPGLLDEAAETTTHTEPWPDCAHCGKPMRGFAQINDDWLCHPDDGMDCYGLVGAGHLMPCHCAQ